METSACVIIRDSGFISWQNRHTVTQICLFGWDSNTLKIPEPFKSFYCCTHYIYITPSCVGCTPSSVRTDTLCLYPNFTVNFQSFAWFLFLPTRALLTLHLVRSALSGNKVDYVRFLWINSHLAPASPLLFISWLGLIIGWGRAGEGILSGLWLWSSKDRTLVQGWAAWTGNRVLSFLNVWLALTGIHIFLAINALICFFCNGRSCFKLG